MRSLPRKFDELQLWFANNQPAIFGVVETWLHKDVLDAEISVPGYDMFRCDRPDSHHGGVLLYVAGFHRASLIH